MENLAGMPEAQTVLTLFAGEEHVSVLFVVLNSYTTILVVA
jgi:hypothetical protein